MRNLKQMFFGKSNDSGNTAIIFGLCLTGICVAAGAAVDYNRLLQQRTAAYALADAAALAAASSSETTQKGMQALASNFVSKNKDLYGLISVEKESYVFDGTTARMTVKLDGTVPTSLMAITGIGTMTYEATSVAEKGAVPPIELVMALDTTGSMSGSKITALKTAADNMVTAILKNPQAKVGIVPFSNYVNIGVSRRNEPSFDVPADYTQDAQSCSTTYPDAKNCKTVKTPTTCYNDGVPYACTSSTTTCDSWGDPVKTCKTVTNSYTFRGCVGSRKEAYRNVISQPSERYPGFLNVNCAAEILDLTDNVTTAKAKVKALTATGETYLPGGLTWGWNMLNPAAPLTSAKPTAELSKVGGMKALVFMTDGANTLVPNNKNASTHVSSSSTYKSIDYSNTLTAQLCENIKKDNITVYTIQFDVVDSSLKKLLTDCASEPVKSYQAANASELVSVFDNIVADLSQVRLVK